jgi:hypothetical protein
MTAPECSELDLFPIVDLSGGAGSFADASVWQCLQAFPEGLGMFLNNLRIALKIYTRQRHYVMLKHNAVPVRVESKWIVCFQAFGNFVLCGARVHESTCGP